jgi:hypothetical protein
MSVERGASMPSRPPARSVRMSGIRHELLALGVHDEVHAFQRYDTNQAFASIQHQGLRQKGAIREVDLDAPQPRNLDAATVRKDYPGTRHLLEIEAELPRDVRSDNDLGGTGVDERADRNCSIAVEVVEKKIRTYLAHTLSVGGSRLDFHLTIRVSGVEVEDDPCFESFAGLGA